MRLKLAGVLAKEQHFVSAFEAFHRSPQGESAPWLARQRRAAIQRFAEIGFPNRRDESWKYFPLTPQAVASFTVGTPPLQEVEPAAIDRLCPLATGARLVFVDGRYRDELSTREALPTEVKVESVSRAVRSGDPSLEAAFGRWSSLEDRRYGPEHAFAALNTAFFTDGSWIHIPAGVELDVPIELVFYSTSASEGNVTHARNLIVAERGSRAEVVEVHAGEDAGGALHNVLMEVALEDNARLDHTKIQREAPGDAHIALLRAVQQANSRLETGFFSFGGRVVRHEIEVRLLGEGCESGLHGLYVVDGERHVDNTTTIHHAKPHCDSREVYKGILSDRASGSFSGKIFVHERAQKTDAKQSNDGLLLSTDAVLNTRPNLEIYADDVKCTHGATVGQLSADALFYLRSRGISAAEARKLLTRAFASEVIESVTDPRLRETLESLLRESLPEGGP